MTTVKAFIKRRPVAAYFILTFAISWGGVLILGAPHGMPTTSEQFEELYPIVFLPYLLGPVISGMLLTALVDGRAGFRELLSRLLRWRVNGRWYALALLIAPLLALLILLPLSLISPDFLPGIVTADDKLALLLMGIAIGFIGGGLMEEPGWTGFAAPRLRRRYGVLATGLIIGFLWGVWHVLPTYWGSGDAAGALSLALLLPPCFFYVAVLPAYRVLMVWVYDRTRSLPVVILMHTSLTASTLFILAPSVEGVQLFLYYFLLAAACWGLVVAVKVTGDENDARDDHDGRPSWTRSGVR
jgi:membrane protease YdiL (CAAX protease family)